MDAREASRKRPGSAFVQAEETLVQAEHAPVDKIQAVVDGEKNQLSTITQMMDKCAESSDHVTAETPVEHTDRITELAKLLNKSEDWIEKRRAQKRENAARSKRIMEDFVRHYVDQEKGCLKEEESDEEDQEEYDARFAMMEKFSAELWSQHNDFSGLN